jgi:hypothetical protein
MAEENVYVGINVSKLWLDIGVEPRIWRCAVELFLRAGENGNDGLLETVTDLAWRLPLFDSITLPV